jgi:NAD/NADP transhydrogenase beta subunit
MDAHVTFYGQVVAAGKFSSSCILRKQKMKQRNPLLITLQSIKIVILLLTQHDLVLLQGKALLSLLILKMKNLRPSISPKLLLAQSLPKAHIPFSLRMKVSSFTHYQIQ